MSHETNAQRVAALADGAFTDIFATYCSSIGAAPIIGLDEPLREAFATPTWRHLPIEIPMELASIMADELGKVIADRFKEQAHMIILDAHISALPPTPRRGET